MRKIFDKNILINNNMVNYFEKFKKQHDGVYNIEMEEYKKYRHLMFDKFAKCPTDPKKDLEKTFLDNGFKMTCGTKFSIEVTNPKIMNVNALRTNAQNEYENAVKKLKKSMITANNELVSDDNTIKDTENNLKNVRDLAEFKENINKIYKFYELEYNKNIEKQKELSGKLLHLKNNQNEIFKKCSPLNNKQAKKIGEYYHKEGIPTEIRLSVLKKEFGLEPKELRYWFQWFENVKLYLGEIKNKKELDENLEIMREEKNHIMNNFIVEPPIIKK